MNGEKYMEELEKKVLNTIKKYELIKSGDNVVIGVSGGPDSITLLNVLNKLKNKLNIQLQVAHINHMLREEADSETEYVKEFCKKINVPCYVKRVDVEKLAKENKLGTEEMGRDIRYNFFEEVRKNTRANKIATAHNANDNAETVLMNIIRGCSISGLKGIEPIRRVQLKNKEEIEASSETEENNRSILIRPIIECTRVEIEQYCERYKLEPKYDKTNNENIYTRNKVRNLLIPYIEKEFNPNIVESINRLSSLSTRESKYIEQIVEKEYQNLRIIGNNLAKLQADNLKEKLEQPQNVKKQIVLDLKKFNNLEPVIKSRILLYTINELLGTTKGIEKIHIEDIIKLCNNNIGNKFLTPQKNIKILVKKGKIFFQALM